LTFSPAWDGLFYFDLSKLKQMEKYFVVKQEPDLETRSGTIIAEYPAFGYTLGSIDVALVRRVPAAAVDESEVIDSLTTPGSWTLNHHEAIAWFFSKKLSLVPKFENSDVKVFSSAAEAVDGIFEYIRHGLEGKICFPDLQLEGIETITLLRTIYDIKLSYLFSPLGRMWVVCSFTDYYGYNVRALDLVVEYKNDWQISMVDNEPEILRIYLRTSSAYKVSFRKGLENNTFVEPEEEDEELLDETEFEILPEALEEESEWMPSEVEVVVDSTEIRDPEPAEDSRDDSMILFVTDKAVALRRGEVVPEEFKRYLKRRFDPKHLFDNG